MLIVKSKLKNTIRIRKGLVIAPGVNSLKDDHREELQEAAKHWIDKGLISIEAEGEGEKRRVAGSRSTAVVSAETESAPRGRPRKTPEDE